MYAVSVSRAFVAQHYLTVPNPDPAEATLHSHHFTVEATFRGPELAAYGYLVDIDAVSEAMDAVVDGLRDETLNDLPAFEGKNPSVERLSSVFADRLLARLSPEAATELRVRIDEDDVATVAHTREL
ncbi:6-pyruvoyl trahydropterin synthase family protein [Halorubrum vacuolatum]|uniref:6-pyruvoyltetrahydropterin/6-carboxytetrahydropterin synthase n=1 Tax=Halorubrum vacuolatum TaxID=63740 RepID=A0A238UN45_HALVU|nr:6-carboxytetrahydropterin synthase [Halorubrum vacuolatum]SNR23351.1 6-pyruvoyltetrahydropterin/6-carboxytetrahydropterin synthase [Halorubrum vacuolatum]